MAKINEYDVVIIGAGQCGVLTAYYLNKYNISYIVLEKDRCFSSWYKRWDNFYMNTANWMNRLPDIDLSSIDGDIENKRANKDQIIIQFEQWLKSFPVNINICNVSNIKLEEHKFIVESERNVFHATIVIFAIGLNQIVIPKFQNKISNTLEQIHSSEFKNSNQIKTSNVLIVGTGSSGVQICKELAQTQKYSVYLSCSKNSNFPWTVFGISIYSYVRKLKLFDIKSQSVLGKCVKFLSARKGDPATPPSPKELQSEYNVMLKNRLIDIKGNDAFFEKNQTLYLNDTTIIWCTGYQLNLQPLIDKTLHNKLLNRYGYPLVNFGFRSIIPNIYYIGLRFQRLVSSHIIYGAVRDAKKLASEITFKINGKR